MLEKTVLRITLGLMLCAPAAPHLSAMQTISSVSCDGSTCPRPLELVNGAPVTIALTGLRLDALASGAVTDGRRAIQGITVELAPLARLTRQAATTSRQVRITAEGVGALSGLRLRFTTSDRGSVTAPLELSVAAVTTAPGIVAPTDPGLQTRTGTGTVIQTIISSASPQIVDVEPGSSVTVTVQGTDLDQLTSARVARNGTPVSHLTAELLSGGSSTSRDVRLTAAQGVNGPWNVPLELVLSGRTAGSHTVPVELYVAMPDLVVENLRPSVSQALGIPPGAGDPWVLGQDKIAYTYDLENRGRAVAAFPVGITAQRLDSPPFQSESTNYSWVYDVPPSGPTQISLYVWEAHETAGAQPGTYTWVLTVDPDNRIAESNESNNEVSIQVRLEEPSADLAITNVTIDPPDPTEVDDIRFHVTVENLGNTPANPAIQSPDCNVFSANQIGGTGTYERLGAGQTLVASIRTDGGVLFMPGTHTCTFSVTSEDAQDTDSSNNEQTHTYTISGVDPLPPDFVITGMRTDPAVPKANTEYVLLATIKNNGPGAHFWNAPKVHVESENCLVDPLGLKVPYSIGTDGSGNPKVYVIGTEPETTFSAGETNDFVMKATPQLMLPAGARDCTFSVATDGPEADKSNNDFRFTWGLIP